MWRVLYQNRDDASLPLLFPSVSSSSFVSSTISSSSPEDSSSLAVKSSHSESSYGNFLQSVWKFSSSNSPGQSSSTTHSDSDSSWDTPSVAVSGPGHRRLQATTETTEPSMELVDLKDFQVQLARVADAIPIQFYDLSELVTVWMNDSFEQQLIRLNYVGSQYAEFKSVLLMERKERWLSIVSDTASSSIVAKIATSSHSSSSTSSTKNFNYLRRKLDEETDPPELDDEDQLFSAEFMGSALFQRNSTSQAALPAEIVLFLQQSAFDNKTGLLELVQQSNSSGLGSSVVDLNPVILSSSTPTNSSGSTSGTPQTTATADPSLQMIIIIAVVVAAVAFIFLLVAIVWAWRYDRRNRQAYLASTARNSNNNNIDSKETSNTHTNKSQSSYNNNNKEQFRGSTSNSNANNSYSNNSRVRSSQQQQLPPSTQIAAAGYSSGDDYEPDVGESRLYPESVISDDISTSLSQYYRSSGLSYAPSTASGNYQSSNSKSGGGKSSNNKSSSSYRARNQNQQQHYSSNSSHVDPHHLNDAASVSSMESYGYSLDGYAPSMVTAPTYSYDTHSSRNHTSSNSNNNKSNNMAHIQPSYSTGSIDPETASSMDDE